MPLVGHAFWRVIVATALLVAGAVTFLVLMVDAVFGPSGGLTLWPALFLVLGLPTIWVVLRGGWSAHVRRARAQKVLTALAMAAGLLVIFYVARAAFGLMALRAEAGVGAGGLRPRLQALIAAGALLAMLGTVLPVARRVAVGQVAVGALVAATAAIGLIVVSPDRCGDVDAGAFRTAQVRAGILESHSERERLADAFRRCGTLEGLTRPEVQARLGGNGQEYDVSDEFFGPATLLVDYTAGRVVSLEKQEPSFD